MKVIKLDARYTLWHHGYHYALKFESWRKNVDAIFAIHKTYGPRETLGHHCKKSSTKGYQYDGEYLMGFKNEQDITATLLKYKEQ